MAERLTDPIVPRPRDPSGLTRDEVRRYSRHLALPEVGLLGQRRLKDASVLVVGAGGLGSPVALYLAAAGVGRIGLVDDDVVDVTNLQRQVLYAEADVGRPKLKAAAERLQGLNPHVDVDLHDVRFTRANALDLVRAYDVLVDASDNFPTRYLANDAAVIAGKPDVYGSVHRFEGQVSVFATRDGPCYRCLYARPPPPGLVPNCAEGGVLGVLPGIVGAVQATETLKILLDVGDTLAGRLLLVDALSMEFTTLGLRKDPACPVCGPSPSITELQDYDDFCGVAAADATDVTPAALKAELDAGATPFLLDVREPAEQEIARLEGAVLVPLAALPSRLAEVPRDRDVVVVCRSGARSAQAVEFLRGAGYARVRNLAGGLNAWADEVDPAMQPY